MTRYRVTISHDACTTHDVEAGSPESAAERAMEGCGSVTLCHHCSDNLTMGDPIRAACVENLDDGSYTDAVDDAIGRKVHPAEYAYSIDKGDTFKGCHPTPEDALGAAHDDLSSQCAAGTRHQVRVARLVPGADVMRSLPHSVRYLAERAIDSLKDSLYDEIGGNNPLIERLTPEQLQQIGTVILEAIAATGAIVGKGLDDETSHTVVIE